MFDRTDIVKKYKPRKLYLQMAISYHLKRNESSNMFFFFNNFNYRIGTENTNVEVHFKHKKIENCNIRHEK